MPWVGNIMGYPSVFASMLLLCPTGNRVYQHIRRNQKTMLLVIFLFLFNNVAVFLFLGATKRHYNWLCPSVGRSVGRSVGLSVTHSFDNPHVAPYWPTWPCYFYSWIEILKILMLFMDALLTDQPTD